MSEFTAPTSLSRGDQSWRRRLALAPYTLTIGAVLRLLKRFESYFDDSDVSRSAAGRRMRLALAAMFGGYACVLEVTSLRHGEVATAPLLLLMLAIALFLGRGGSFVYYFMPAALGLISYLLAGQLVAGLALPVHYTPQIDAERLLPGPMPSLWLQQHLYHGTAGVLDGFAISMYLSHFAIPLAFGFGLAMTRKGRAFASLMFGLLVLSVLGELTFVLAPTAPPWLAAQEGYLPGVQHILRQSLYDFHFTSLANLVGDRETYDTTAAIPSLHAAFPFVCLLTARRFGLPRWLQIAFVLNVVGVTFAIVYTGDHYLVDAVVGFAYAVVACAIVHRVLAREGRSENAQPAIISPPVAGIVTSDS